MTAQLRQRFVLAAILLLALLLRWPLPEPGWLHVDERAFVVHPLGFWSGDLNPHFFNYPTLQLYIASVLYYLYYLCGGEAFTPFLAFRYFVEAPDLIAIARGLTTVMAVATVAVIARIGQLMYGFGWGAFAAVLLAAMPLHVRFSHLAITDTPALFWIALAMLFAVRIARGRPVGHPVGRPVWDYALAGLCVGLAASTKYPAAMAAVPVAVAALLRRPSLLDMRLWLAGVVAALSFAATSPYVLLDFDSFWAAMSAMSYEHVTDSTQTSTDYAPWIHHLLVNLRYGLGVGALIAAGVGLLWRPRSLHHTEWVMVSAVVAFAALLFVGESVFMRYALPLALPLTLLAVRAVAVVPAPRALRWLGVIALVAEPGYGSLQTRLLAGGPDTRDLARQQIHAARPAGGSIVHAPAGAGNVDLLHPNQVYVRRRWFLESYDVRVLRDVYRSLIASELPPLYVTVPLESIRDGDGAAGAAGLATVIAAYDHPVIVDRDGIDADLAGFDWQMEFLPGAHASSVFDPVDYYFTPVGRWGAVAMTGPRIRLTVSEVGYPVPTPTAKEFFDLLLQHELAQEAIAAERWPVALAILRTAATLPYTSHVLTQSSFFGLHLGRGVSAFHLGYAAEAIEALRLAVAVKPRSAPAQLMLGRAYLIAASFPEATRHCQLATRLAPDDASAHFFLGLAHAESGNSAAARAALERAHELNPDDGDVAALLLALPGRGL